jgi:hypothetical protein
LSPEMYEQQPQREKNTAASEIADEGDLIV